MVLKDHITTYTATDLWELSQRIENDGKRFILIEGVIYEMPPASWKHGDIAGVIFGLLWVFLRKHPLGRLTAAETGYRLSQDGKIVLAPDVGFIANERIPDELPDTGYVPFAPDLAVEVVSPGNSANEISLKVSTYLQYGTQQVWLVYPEQQTVEVYTPNGNNEAQVKYLSVNDVLDGGDMLAGFTLKISEIFPS